MLQDFIGENMSSSCKNSKNPVTLPYKIRGSNEHGGGGGVKMLHQVDTNFSHFLNRPVNKVTHSIRTTEHELCYYGVFLSTFWRLTAMNYCTCKPINHILI